jgi:hypothetical protein|tara:strand:- start:756 stop:1352 length:597 start_codon:yes stop_codon:yes gene_type:complete
MKNLYVQIPILDEGQCLGIINEVNAFENIVGGCVTDDTKDATENHMIDSIRKTKESYLLEQSGDYRSNPKLDWSWLQEKMFNKVKFLNDERFKFNIEQPEGELKYIEYGVGDHYNWHIDMNPNDKQPRKLTGIIMLNDEFEGGYLQFGIKDKENEWVKVPKLRGSLIVFPSFLSHRVSPVTDGMRYSIQEFYVGDNFV